MDNAEWRRICTEWDAAPRLKDFRRFLLKDGWSPASVISIKSTYSKNGEIIKFDDVEKWDTAYGDYGIGKHTRSEHLAWVRSARNRKRHKYITPTLRYYKGLLLQPLIKPCDVDTNIHGYCPHNAKKIALAFRFSHWWNHGTYKGHLVFFDVDSCGSGWHNWKNRKRAVKTVTDAPGAKEGE